MLQSLHAEEQMFQNDNIPLSKRIELFHTLILSRLTYGSETRTCRTLKAKEFLHAAVIRLYKRLLRCSHSAHHTGEWVVTQLGLPTPTELFRQARLRYLGTLHACATNVTWGLINQDSEWCILIQDDLNWMWKQLANSSPLRDPAAHFESWRALWTLHRPYWKDFIKRAVQHAILQRHSQFVVKQGHGFVLDLLQHQDRIAIPDDLPCARLWLSAVC